MTRSPWHDDMRHPGDDEASITAFLSVRCIRKVGDVGHLMSAPLGMCTRPSGARWVPRRAARRGWLEAAPPMNRNRKTPTGHSRDHKSCRSEAGRVQIAQAHFHDAGIDDPREHRREHHEVRKHSRRATGPPAVWQVRNRQ
jgi:hypothetical protein